MALAGLLLPLLAAQRGARAADAAGLSLYPPTPGAVTDPRLRATIQAGGGSAAAALTAALEVEDAPAVPQTRDPGHGRPPFTSSRLRLWSDAPVRVQLACLDGQQPCSFASTPQLVLRGVGAELAVERGKDNKTLSFTLPPPAAGRLATHFYLQASIAHAAGPQHFARGQLFLFWIDSPPAVSGTGSLAARCPLLTPTARVAGGARGPPARRDAARGGRQRLNTADRHHPVRAHLPTPPHPPPSDADPDS